MKLSLYAKETGEEEPLLELRSPALKVLISNNYVQVYQGEEYVSEYSLDVFNFEVSGD